MDFLATTHRKSVIGAGVCSTSLFLLSHAVMPFSAVADTIDKYLEMDLSQLMQVTITSVSKKPQTLSETAAAVYVITQEEIHRSGVTSIPQALALAPGLQVSQISAGKWSIAARGFAGYTSNKLLVLMDGRSLYSPAYSGTFWDAQNIMLEDVERIEVIRGPGGTIWGANAVNGVINIITKKAQDTEGTLLSARIGTNEQYGASARSGSKVGDDAAARLYVTTSKYGSNQLKDDFLSGYGRDANDDWGNVQGGFRMDGKVGSNDEWTLQGDIYRMAGDQIVFPYWTANNPYPSANYDEYSGHGANVIANWQHRIDADSRLSLKAYYDDNSRKEAFYGQTFNTFDLDVQYEFALGSWNNVTSGLGYRNIDGRFNNTYMVTLADQNQNLYSGFLQDQIKLIDRFLWLTLGTKYEHNDFTGNEWQPSIRLLLKPDENQSLWASVARAVRTPSTVERTGSVVAANYQTPIGVQKISILGNSAFDVETLIAYEVGYRWQAKRNISFDIAAYYNDYDDIYDTTLSANPMLDRNLYFTNAQKGTGYGLEVATAWQATTWLSLSASYSWQKLDLEYKSAVLEELGSKGNTPSANSPRNQLAFRSLIEFTKEWQGNIMLRYVDSFNGRDSVNLKSDIPIDAEIYLDANLIWKPMKNVEVMFAGQNLTDSSQLEYVSEMITPPTEIRRVVYTKVTWSF